MFYFYNVSKFRPLLTYFSGAKQTFFCGTTGAQQFYKNTEGATLLKNKSLPQHKEHSSTPEGDNFTPTEVLWNQWLAGLIDGDGSLLVRRPKDAGGAKRNDRSLGSQQNAAVCSPMGYCSCEITMDLQDEHALQQIKSKLGGSIKLRSGVKALRYRLHHREGIRNLLKRINGEIRYEVRQEQLKEQCNQMQMPFLRPRSSLSKKNGWFAGVFDADGTVTLSVKRPTLPIGSRVSVASQGYPQCTISVSAKRQENLLPWKAVFAGNIYFDKSSRTYKWSIQSKENIFEFVQYIKDVASSRSSKKNRLYLIPRLYELIDLKAYKADKESKNYFVWEQFLEKWRTRTL